MKWLSKRLLDMRFRTRLLLTYLLVALLPLALFASVSVGVFISREQATALAHTGQTVEQVGSTIDVYIQNLDKLADFIRIDLVGDGYNYNYTKDQSDELEQRLYNLQASHPELAGIMVALESDLCVGVGMQRISRDSFEQEDWYREAVESAGGIALVDSIRGRSIITGGGYGSEEVFSVAKAMLHPTGWVMGVVLFDVYNDVLIHSINNITIGENGFVFVTDADNRIIYTPVSPVVYRVNPAWLSGPQQSLTVGIDGARYQIYYESSAYTGWKTVGVFALDEIMGGVNSVLWLLIPMVILAIAIVLFVSIRLSNSVTKPLLKLQKLMKQAEKGDLSVQFNTQYHDEIGELADSFNHMLLRIEELIQMVYREQRSKQDAEMKALQEQIKPHFLYNTLDTISWMAREREAEDIVLLVDALTSMFRIGLSQGRDVISLEEEISHISNYLYIQQIRYQSKLEYTIDIDGALAGVRVPKLILQPLVENAIYHGIKQKRGRGHIAIEGHAEAGYVLLNVRDDGAGMAPEALETLRTRLSEPPGNTGNTSFGLFYIRERMRLLYGDDWCIGIESKEGEGTGVQLRLPLHIEHEEETPHV